MRIVVEIAGGLVTNVATDGTQDIEVIVLNWDRESEPRADTASFLWTYRHVIRPVGPRQSHESSPGESQRQYELREELFPNALY